jgi:hypothetical protein
LKTEDLEIPMNLQNIIITPLVRRFKRWDRRLSLTKRQQFVLAIIILTAGLLLTQIVPTDFRYAMVALLAVVTYFVSALTLREDLKGIEWLTLLTLPTLFTAGLGLFYFLLPVRWLTRIPVALLYAVSMYGLILTENIYNIAANRTIALLRAAHSVGFLLTLVVFFLLSETIFSIRTNPVFILIGIACICALLSVQILWAVLLEANLGRQVAQLCTAVTVAIVQVAWLLSFWPANITLKALFLTTCFYGVTGMAQQYLMDKLYKKTATEFLAVVAVVLIILLFGTQWRGNF